jgi:hypothetical protein
MFLPAAIKLVMRFGTSAPNGIWNGYVRRNSYAIVTDADFNSLAARGGGVSKREVHMNGNRYYGVRVEGAKYGVGFGSALAIAISYTANHSILWAIIRGIFGWLYVIYFALYRS